MRSTKEFTHRGNKNRCIAVIYSLGQVPKSTKYGGTTVAQPHSIALSSQFFQGRWDVCDNRSQNGTPEATKSPKL